MNKHRVGGFTILEVSMALSASILVSVMMMPLVFSLVESSEKNTYAEIAEDLKTIVAAIRIYGQQHSWYSGVATLEDTNPQSANGDANVFYSPQPRRGIKNYCGLIKNRNDSASGYQPFLLSKEALKKFGLLPKNIAKSWPDSLELGEIEYWPNGTKNNSLKGFFENFTTITATTNAPIAELTDFKSFIEACYNSMDDNVNKKNAVVITISATDPDVILNLTKFLENYFREAFLCYRLHMKNYYDGTLKIQFAPNAPGFAAEVKPGLVLC